MKMNNIFPKMVDTQIEHWTSGLIE